MFLVALVALLLGFPVAFTFGGIALLFGVWAEGPEMFAFMPYRIESIMQNTVLMAVPLFIFMGLVLQKTRLAEQLLEAMGRLFGTVRGGIAISTVLVGALLAASTGVVGASVVAMGLISLPVMLKYNYDKGLACGTICASGTLGQIIPPSIVLILLGDVLGVPVGDLFQAAVGPGLVLVGAYVVYILIYAKMNPEAAQPIERDESISRREEVIEALKAVVPPMALIVVVLGSIFAGIATPTESAALGGAGAIVLALLYRQFSWAMIYDASKETVKVTAMVFAILLGATAFSMAFTYTGGDYLVEEWMMQIPGEKWGFLIITMLVILILGFFIDFVEICFIIVPILAPVAELMGINMVWFAILVAMNLQTSFLTPPFGFSLFYLKGVAPKGVTTRDIYRGVMPFIAIQILVLASILLFPSFYGM
ncbi:putative TRAP-type C4-dicarboxylate transport system, large permease component DctM subunit [Vibrio nigripulchritudo MADA3029]|uniref:TRAP transporter large permease protein n=3 Tax=Vibrionaceae TaxID=641 RepID=U4KCG4_9VIBR|nr:putative TRAP-type C4-dicarboxylate transport system, large permease component DctM subunit [Vibrio nigripulchritudo AM115]CCN41455.1 putative TRAP-type C4-dicarboxylate transport system, large permease component DctM subunit [Vibrio nigripulchritudo FTn2]CCN50507.1 putative TRAP-type C4-dicarboxylate transport system, large permease component DctM subunit [Vibrio nigripulchritudo MADA3020]CCN52459.1 putative TRAP-type C4-dicarboxylate transport system, large permease component DctM subunit [